MSLSYSNSNHVKVYNISGQSSRTLTTPKWLEQQSSESLKKNQDWQNRIDLIQDFEFPEASLRLKLTKDGKFCMATGIYKPQIRLYEFSEMSLKFERHTDYDNINFVMLSDDWTKSVHLQSNRTLEFHSHFGRHYSMRIPKFGRDLDYHYPSADLYICGATNDIFRLNLEQGRFLNPFITDSPSVNKLAVNPAHQLLCFGGEDGYLEFWDPRIKSRITRIHVNMHLVPYMDSTLDTHSGTEVSALSFRNDGLHLAVGTNSGHVLLYDMRSPDPRLVKDHQYGLNIRHVHWHDASDNVISADSNIVRIWNNTSGKHFTSIEPSNAINDICVVPDSGLLFVTGEQVQMCTYLIPDLGPTPRFAQFLDHLTEELAESQQPNLYDHYKFVTKLDLEKLNSEHLIGTSAAKAYMHGYFIDFKLYERIKAITNPFAYLEYKQKRVQEKLNAKRESRILSAKSKLVPKVNADLAEKLGGMTSVDDRFKDVFEDSEFHVDKDSETYKLLNPVVSTKQSKKKSNAVYHSSDEDENNESTLPNPSKPLPNKDGSVSFARSSKKSNADDRILQRQHSNRAHSSKNDKVSEKSAASSGPSMTELQTQRSLCRKQPFSARIVSETGATVTNSRSISGALEMKFNVSSKPGGRGRKKQLSHGLG